MVNGVLAAITASLVGNTNLEDGMFWVLGICPMMAGLHDPVAIWIPLVMG